MSAILERLRTEEQLAKNGDTPILARSFSFAIAEIERLETELRACTGYMTNAAIDLETGAPKRTALATINGGIKRARAALSAGESVDNGTL